MILPTIRASFGRNDALHLVELLGRDDEELRRSARERLEDEGLDSLLDDPRVLNALLTDPGVTAPPELIFYVLVRQSLLEGGIDDPATADFVASLVSAFGHAGRAYRPVVDGEEFHYLTDLVTRLAGAGEAEAFVLRSHLGNYSLWLAGLFPDYLEARATRRGAPGIAYYEQLGASGYRAAGETRRADDLGVGTLFVDMASQFGRVRVALNRVADRHLWPGAGDPVGRVLREASSRGDAGGLRSG